MNRLMNSRLTIVIFFLGLFACTEDQAESAPLPQPVTPEMAIEVIKKSNAEATFEYVRDEVRYEPYGGVLRGSGGTALTKSGNAMDQALLLVSVLDGQIEEFRFAQGALEDDSINKLLNGAYTEEQVAPDLDGPLTRYDITADKQLRRLVRNHIWVEVKLNGDDNWTALDPSMPDAEFGMAPAEAKRTFTDLKRFEQKLGIRLKAELASGKVVTLANYRGAVHEMAPYPIAYVARGIPQLEPVAKPKQSGGNPAGLLGGGAGGLFGGGSTPQEEPEAEPTGPRDVVGIQYRRELLAAGEPLKVQHTMVSDNDTTSRIAREWIEFSLSVPGVGNQRFERELFNNTYPGKETPAEYRRYSIAVVPGRISRATLEDYRTSLDLAAIEGLSAELEHLKTQEATNETAQAIIELESNGSVAAHLINLAFAHESDELTDRLATNTKVVAVRDVPRVLITSIETNIDGDDVHTDIALDLRSDTVKAIPYPGMATGASTLFQRARGMQESALEGRVLARFVDEQVITTPVVLEAAQDQGHELVVIGKENRTLIAELPELPSFDRELIANAIDAGRRIIVSSAPAIMDDRPIWAWWDEDPGTGAFVGVVSGGQHAAMVNYVVTQEEIAVNDTMGYVIGALVGATATTTLYSAKMLEYGQVTPQLLAEVAAGIEQLTCVTCPGIEVKVGAWAGASIEATCLGEHGKGVIAGGMLEAGSAFCENYKSGISCAASVMLGSYEVKANTPGGVGAEINMGPLDCK